MIESIQSIQAVSQFAAGAISSIWQGVVLAALVWTAIKLAPRTTANIRFLLWTIAFLAILLLPALASLSARTNPVTDPISLHNAAHAIVLDSDWAFLIIAGWAIMSSARFVSLIRNAIRLASVRNHAVPVDSTPSVSDLLGQAALRNARLCTSSEIDQPCVIGFFAPRILIPDWLLEKATAAELEQIVMHEMAHLRRFDDWTNLLQKLALALFPFNPALLWIERQLCAEREVACDESVVRATSAPREYATCLTNLAEQRTAHRSAALSLGAWEHRPQLTRRIESILRGESGLSPMKARVFLATLALATTVGAIQLGSSAQLVSFAAPEHDFPVAQLRQPSMNTPHYQDVVFHEPSSSNSSIQQPRPASNRPAKQPHLRPALKNSPRRANASADGVESFVVVTRWQDNAGRQLTVIDKFVRISASPAAQVQSGWFVVQL